MKSIDKTFSHQVNTIRNAFSEMPDIQDGFRDVKDRLLDMNLQAEEKQHRKGRPSGKLSTPTAARYFVVRHLLDSCAEPTKYTVDDILSIRTECLFAQAYAKRFKKELKAWAAKYSPLFKSIDYAELMK